MQPSSKLRAAMAAWKDPAAHMRKPPCDRLAAAFAVARDSENIELATEALAYAKVILADALPKDRRTVPQMMKDPSLRKIIETASLGCSDLRRKDHMLSRKEQP